MENEIKDSKCFDNQKVEEYLDNLLDSLLEVRKSIRDCEPEEMLVPKFKGLLMILGRYIELEVASNIKL